MKKTLNITWKVFLILILVVSFIFTGVVITKRDEIITSAITMKYFEKVVNENDETMIESFVAKSKEDKDRLKKYFSDLLNHQYHYPNVTNFSFKITNTEVFGTGKYQCYFTTESENYIPKCDLENEGRYINYIIDAEVSYKRYDEEIKQKEKGLVVFVKDAENGNYFTWKLVRFNRYEVE